MTKDHELKTWPAYFDALVDGSKTFELRKNDRGFEVGDTLVLQEFVPHKECGGTGRVWDNGDKTDCSCEAPHGEYTGREIRFLVSYKMTGPGMGLQEGWSVLGLAERLVKR